ncbi:uncharacterized protein [Cicer arietinum]|uniref:uncharacterized protein n=1 Tax=Cicer arietinum TaxID=3827 RepID=UPI003CC5546F
MASVSGVGGSAGGSGGSDGSGGTGTAAIRGISKTSRGKKKVAKRVVNDPSLMPMPSIGTSGGAIPLYPEVPVEPYTLDEIMDPGCVDCYNRIVIIPEGDGYLPFKSSAKAIAEVIQEKYKKPWLSWGEIKEDKTPQIREVDQFLHCFKNIPITIDDWRDKGLNDAKDILWADIQTAFAIDELQDTKSDQPLGSHIFV